jgi:hypothetical protein
LVILKVAAVSNHTNKGTDAATFAGGGVAHKTGISQYNYAIDRR